MNRRAWWVRVLAVLCLIRARRLRAAGDPPPLSEDDLLLLQTVQLLGTAASEVCQQHESMRRYVAQRQSVTEHFERKYGYTVDWSVLPAKLKAKGS